MDETLKKQFEYLCSDFGMNMTTVFTIFAKAVVRERKIPFEITESKQEMKSLEEMSAEQHFSSLVKAMLSDGRPAEEILTELKMAHHIGAEDAASVLGVFSKYANTGLISKEKEAWGEAVMEKHAAD